MSVLKDLLIKVKAVFEAPIVPDAPAAPAPQVYKLKDGTEISIAIKDPAVSVEPSIGDAVTVNGAPAAEGDLELEDGTKLTIGADGTIANIVAIEPVTQPDFVAPPTVEERLAAVEAELAKLKAPVMPAGCATVEQFSEVSGKFEAQKLQIKKNDEVIAGLFELVEKLIAEPSGNPKTLTGSKKEKFDKQAAADKKFEAYAEAFASIKGKAPVNPAAE